jgi:hypothetical protein
VVLNFAEFQRFAKKEPPMLRSIEKKMAQLNGALNLYVSNLSSTNGKKNCVQMATENNISHDELYRAQTFLTKKLIHLNPLLLSLGVGLAMRKQGYLVADLSLISKTHSKKIEGAGWGYSGSKDDTDKGLMLIIIMWTNGHIKVPLAYEIFIPEAIAGDKHVKAYESVLKMVVPISQKLGCFTFLADGAFSNETVIKTLNDHGIAFVMRFASSRKIETLDGVKQVLTKHPALRFDRNVRTISIKAQWHGLCVYITVSRQRNTCNEWEYRYLVSNRSNEKIPHIKTYDKRWAIEVFFRSAKQDFGLGDCQSRSLDRQKVHIVGVCFAFLKHEETKALNDNREQKRLKERKILFSMLKNSFRSMGFAYA